MTNSYRFGRSLRSLRSKSHKRRPAGISRRRKKQLGFETLEDRRVMSAESPLPELQAQVGASIGYEITSFSSNTPEGAWQILQNELYWQSLLEGGSQESLASFSIPSDPLVANQWHLINTGQQVGNPDFQSIFGTPGEDINVAAAWQLGYTGEGVVVGVFEPEGFFELTHPDLEANLHPTLSFDGITTVEATHPTNVAGILGAVADNGIGGTGVAPGVLLVPMSLGLDSLTQAEAWRFTSDNGIDITNNSWGPAVSRGVAGPDFIELLGMRDSILFGRPDEDGNPLGVIHVFAAGNDAGAAFDVGFPSQGSWDSSTYDGYVNSRYTIGVTGVDHDGFYNNFDGTVTNYPETSASVLVAAPTGSFGLTDIADDTGVGSGIYTTDLTGENGANGSDNTGFPFGDRDFLEDIDYTSRFNGTSAATPMVSGVIALMLEANPNLSWRDVQEILVRSARQNAEFDVPIAAGVGATQNTWIQNQMPMFHDPDLWDPTINPFTQTFNPTLNPALSDAGLNPGPGPTPNLVGQFLNSVSQTGAHYQPTPQGLTNSAGYTISQGKGVHGELIGYAHGTVDAELAVLLAEQWHTKNQVLPNELTFTSFINPHGGFFINVPAAEVGSIDTGFQYVPGGFGGAGGFIDFWEEYFEDDPFADNPLFPERGSYVELSVPDSNAMTIENVEVKISLLGDTASDLEFLDNMRVTLISPTGTHHELNHFFVDYPDAFIHQNRSDYTFENSPALTSVDTDPDNPLVVTFSSNRSWGERSDNAIIFDPTTAEPANTSGNGLQGWQLHFENYSLESDAGVTGIEVVWHGSPVDSETFRVQGLVGVDDGVDGIGARDDQFNFSRVSLDNSDVDGVVRFSEVTNTIDTLHESMGANVTVTARRASDNVVVDQFVTGADGNYYFDLVPDDYIISVEDALGRTAVDDTHTPAGFLKDFQTEWLVTTDFFKVWDYDTNLEVPLQAATQAPFSFSGNAIPDHVKHINFLLDPGTPAAPQVEFAGVVYADTNGDGLFNGDDVAMPGVGVFGDVNRNGSLDAGEILVETDASGEYLLTVPTFDTTVMNVGVRPPANWTPSNPATGYQPFFVEQGDTFSGVDFHITPPLGSTPGDGSALSGIILGTVFNDKNGDFVSQADEFGVPNITVYIDMNNSGANDAGDVVTETNSNGAYAFAKVPDGDHFLRVELDPNSGISQTFPEFELSQFAAIVSGGTVTDVLFGVSSGGEGSEGILDYGDLPDVYGTTLITDGARHPEGIFFLGTMIDSEADGIPTSDALGDDSNFLADEDGVVLVGGELVPDSTGTLTVTASRHGGYLQAWFDFNNDGDFLDTIDGVFEQVVIDELLDPGANVITFDIPETLGDSTIYARFRYGEFGLGSTGLAQVGEVEDYAFSVAVPDPPLVLIHGPDFNEDGEVSGFDFLAWQLGFGMADNASAADGDSNSDGDVDAADLADWEAEYDAGSSTANASAQTGDFDQDGQVSGSDFLAWQINAGTQVGAALSEGDGNLDGDVDTNDLSVWEDSYGTDATGSSTPVSAAASSGTSTRSVTTPTALSESTVSEPSASELDANATSSMSNGPANRALAFVASEAQRLFERSHRFGRHNGEFQQRARIESHAIETSFGESADFVLDNLDRAMDHLSNRRDRLFDQLPHLDDQSRPADQEPENAFEKALGEEIEWRFA